MRKNLRNLLACLLALAVLLPFALPARAADTSGTCGENLTWTLENGVLTISGTGDMTDWEEANLTPWYGSQGKITALVIERGVTSIGDVAFNNCYRLTAVTIPDSVTSIGDWAFSECSGLTAVSIPNGVTRIGEYAFYQCYHITEVAIPNSVTSIGECTFEGCSGLTEVTIPDSVTSIGSGTFSDCTGLTTVMIPDSVTSIGRRAFSFCLGLTEVTIPNGVISIGEYAFYQCYSITEVAIPNSVTSIGECAFEGCSGLTEVTIPDSVTSIGECAFVACKKLNSITVSEGNRNYTSENGVLFDKNKKTLEVYPGGKTGAYSIPDSVTSIGNHAFGGCDSLTAVTIPDSVTSIGNYAFSGCYCLTEMTIPASVTSIGAGAFNACTQMTGIAVKSGNTAYTSLDGILFNKRQDEIISYPARKRGTTYVIPDSVASIGDRAFSYCSGLTAVIIPDSVTNIGEYAFVHCDGLTEVTIPDGVTGISFSSFMWCTGLTAVTIPATVTSIGDVAFYDCSSLKDVYYGGAEEQWKQITIGIENDPLTNAQIHYNSGEPDSTVPELSIASVVSTADGFTVSCSARAAGTCLLAAAAYDADGKMTAMQIKETALSQTFTTVDFALNGQDAVKVRAFLLDSALRPLCAPQEAAV